MTDPTPSATPVAPTLVVDGTAPIDIAGSELVPVWLRQVAAYGWRVLVILALGFVLAVLAGRLAMTTSAIIVAIIVAATFAPFVRALQVRFGWSRTIAALVVSVVALLVVLVAAGLILFAFAPYVAQLVSAIQNGVDELHAWLTQV